MKSVYIFIVTLFICTATSAQSLYEAGYFIDNKGKRKECLIKNLSWKDNPTEFFWKKNISSRAKKETIKNIKEFSVGKEFLFKRFTLKYDKKGNVIKKSKKKKTVFLRFIIKSKASLYQYSENNKHQFFYTSLKSKHPTPLLAKNTFKKQLAKKLRCKNQDASKLAYTEKDLKKYFKKYNRCKGYKIKYRIRNKINQTKIGVIAAADLVNFSHLSAVPSSTDEKVTYETIYTPRYGMYIESFIPSSTVGISFFLEATYRDFSIQGEDPLVSNLTYILDYKTLNLAFAPRLHIYLSSSFEFFFEGGVNAGFDLGIESTNAFAKEDIQNISNCFFYGAGLGAGIFKIGYRQYTPTNFSKSTAIPENTLTTSSFYISLNIL